MARKRRVPKGAKKAQPVSADGNDADGDAITDDASTSKPTNSVPSKKGKRKSTRAASKTKTSSATKDVAKPPPKKKKRSISPKKSKEQPDEEDENDGEWKPPVEKSEDSDENDFKPAAKKRKCSPKRAKVQTEKEEEDSDEDSKPSAPIEQEANIEQEAGLVIAGDKSEGGEKKGLVCPTCNKTFSSKGGFKYHVDKKVCHEEQKNRVFKCPTCEREFSTEKRLATHLATILCRPKSTKEKGDDNQKAVGSKKKSKDEDSKKKSKSKNNTRKADPEKSVSSKGTEDGDGDTKKTPKKRNTDGAGRAYEKFDQLKPGSKFFTKFGVVKVIADDKLPTIHHNSTICKNKVRVYDKGRGRFIAKRHNLRDKIAVGTRYRREELKKMYTQTKDTSAVTTDAQRKVWGLYCASMTTKEILEDGISWKGNYDKLLKGKKIDFLDDRDNPRCPVDYYSERIVKCKLVADTQEVIVGSIVEDDDGGHHRDEYHTTRRARKAKDVVVPKMSLHISRKELTQVYNAARPRYVCAECGRSYQGEKAGLKYHLNSGCTTRNKIEQEERERRIQAVDTKALSEGSCCVDKCLDTLQGVISALDVKIEDLPADFGNPHKIKDHKKNKMPPWLVFNADRSSMYPETYVALEYRRGSQNRNHFTKMKQEEGYVSKTEKSRLRKRQKKVRMIDPGAKPSAPIVWKCPKCTREFHYSTPNCVAACTGNHLKNCDGIPPKASTKKTLAKKANVKEKSKPAGSDNVDTLPLPPAHSIDKIVDSQQILTQTSAKKKSAKKSKAKPVAKETKSAEPKQSSVNPALPPPLPPIPGSDNTDVNFTAYSEPMSFDDLEDFNKESTAAQKSEESSRRRKRVMVSKKKGTIVVDTQVLATECDAGRYPTINRFDGVHESKCILCKNDEDEPLINCDYCKNTVHQTCLDKRMLNKDPQVVIRENEPHDTPMCHDCITVCMFRRSRAENRRVSKWQHELSKAGLENAPEAASLTEEVKLKDNEGPGEDDEPTYKPCPDGGPGGLICCSYCTATYSRFLSNTAKEMEAQSVAKVGQEVSEIMELLANAKQRLQRASDVNQENEHRRGLLDKNQSAHRGHFME